MSRCTVVRLPKDVCVGDVATVIGLLLGNKRIQNPIGIGGWFTSAVGTEVKALLPDLPTCPHISIALPGRRRFDVMFHYEFDAQRYGLMLPYKSDSIALARRLVEFFGGEVDYNDCDSKLRDYACGTPRDSNFVEDGKAWQEFQHAMYDIRPITQQEIEACKRWYKQ